MRIAADYDIVPAQTSLAELLAASNPTEALEWFEKAAEQGDSNAHVALPKSIYWAKTPNETLKRPISTLNLLRIKMIGRLASFR